MYVCMYKAKTTNHVYRYSLVSTSISVHYGIRTTSVLILIETKRPLLPIWICDT